MAHLIWGEANDLEIVWKKASFLLDDFSNQRVEIE